MNLLTNTSNRQVANTDRSLSQTQATQPTDQTYEEQTESRTLLQSVIEGLVDGILIVTDEGKIVHANNRAQRICRLLNQEFSRCKRVPQPIWHVCQLLIQNRDLYPEQLIILEDEIHTCSSVSLRIRARWLELKNVDRPCLLVTLEDRFQSVKNLAIAEARKYNLTERETQVWMLKRAEYSYKAIAAELHIALDTVKKHLKSIHAKRDAFHWEEE